MLLGGTNIEEVNEHTLDRVVTITLNAVAHASNLDNKLGGEILYTPSTGALLNDHTANVRVIIESRLKNNFKKVLGA